MKAVFSDFDGTLSQNFISMQFIDYLKERWAIPHDNYKSQMHFAREYEMGKISYEDWLDVWAKLWAQGLEGHRVDRIMSTAKEFYEGFRPNIYPSSYEAMAILKAKGYHTVLVSAGVYEAVSLAADDMGMDACIATKCEIRDGAYTGQLTTEIHRPAGKAAALTRYIKEHGIDASLSIGLGDSGHDASLLSVVGFPIALNPSTELENMGEKRGWAVEDKDSILRYLKIIT